ncbi:hypothetical protein I41_43600 [Lacipirellula limnantheis]|uniref:Uncharacterized protein n=1 Tax=Lacipirellula limnantheis TaxID=2528024 RepID=A0A517U3F4_9BACT|nr:hypothetical protein I41_43600 [Lacipirellula limnantheis]
MSGGQYAILVAIGPGRYLGRSALFLEPEAYGLI